MRDAATGRARGFAFVEMATDEEAQKAASELNQYQMGGRALTVNEARPKPEGGFGGGAGYGGNRGGGGRGGGRREPRWSGACDPKHRITLKNWSTGDRVAKPTYGDGTHVE